MKTLVENVNGFDIYFEALPEDIPLRDLLPEESEESLEEIYNNNEIFCAKITAVKHGIELSSEYLGGCIYENVEDFYTKYKTEYYSDMVETVTKKAREVIIELVK